MAHQVTESGFRRRHAPAPPRSTWTGVPDLATGLFRLALTLLGITALALATGAFIVG